MTDQLHILQPELFDVDSVQVAPPLAGQGAGGRIELSEIFHVTILRMGILQITATPKQVGEIWFFIRESKMATRQYSITHPPPHREHEIKLKKK